MYLLRLFSIAATLHFYTASFIMIFFIIILLRRLISAFLRV
jgi:hypothetical protein